MLRPLQLPPNAPELAVQRAAEYALGVADVAALLGVSKQTAYEWTRTGRVAPDGGRTVLPWLRPPTGAKQEPLRFRLADVQAFAKSHHLACDVARLPLLLQRQLGVGAFDPALPERAVVDDELVSELAAAGVLGIGRSRLNKIRTRGRLNPGIRTEGSRYSLIDLWKVADGELELLAPPPPPMPLRDEP